MSIGEKTLALDDDRDLVEIIRTVLESHGYQVNTANEPRTGPSKAPTNRLDLMLVDVIMPTGTEGHHVSGRLEIYSRSIPATRRSSPRVPLKDVAVPKPRRSGQPQPVGWGNRESGEI